MTPGLVVLSLLCVAAAFVVSASVGLGGSLVLVPALALTLGPKEGAALAALLLASNNVVKLVLYRATIPWRAAIPVIAATVAGAAVGARLLVAVSSSVVAWAVIGGFAAAFVLERRTFPVVLRRSAPAYAVASGLTSGFSGTSGPLKGVALRALGLDRRHFVGAASAVSLLGDVTKAAVFTDAGLLSVSSYWFTLGCVPVMVAASLAGRRLNAAAGERGYAYLFWTVMAGYTCRLLGAF